MKLLNFIPAVLGVFLILGILTGFYLSLDFNWVIISLFISLFFLGISFFVTNASFKKSPYFVLLSYLLFFNIGIASVTFQNQRLYKKHYTHFIKNNNTVILSIKKQLKPNQYYTKYEANISQINDYSVFGIILLNISIDSLVNFEVGDKIAVKLTFKKINEPKNLYQFNYRKYLEKKAIYHQVFVKKEAVLLLNNRKITINRITSKFRKKINKSLSKYHFSKDELAIINALLLGQRNDVSKELLASYSGAGAMHILAVSGLHIGILLLLLNLFFKPLEQLKNGKTIKLILIIVLLWVYALIAGSSPSIIRAVSMFTAISIGLLSNKKTNTLHNLFISLFFLLLINPLYIFSVGFQLSYLAVFSIVYFYPLFIRFYNPTQWLIKKVWQLFAISFSAQLGILPLSLYYFHQFPSLFFISSLVIIPLLGFILGFGIVIITLSMAGILPQFMANSFAFIISKLNEFVLFIAAQESFLIQHISFSMALLITSYFVIISAYHLWENSTFKKLMLVGIAILSFQGVLIYKKWQVQSNSEMIIFNQNKHSIISYRTGFETQIFHNIDTDRITKNYALISYFEGVGNLKTNYYPIKNVYQFSSKKMLLIDSLAIYDLPNFSPDIVLLTQSPKVNLNRLIKKLHPNTIVADGSNYKSYKAAWKKTCLVHKINFQDTSITGAFVFRTN